MSKQQDIPQSDNELIAEFMGFTPRKYAPDDEQVVWCDAKHKLPVGELRFENSWDWIIPVVQKIAKMYDPDYEDGKYYHVNFAHNLLDLNLDEPIENVYREVVKSIKWFNQQTPKP